MSRALMVLRARKCQRCQERVKAAWPERAREDGRPDERGGEAREVAAGSPGNDAGEGAPCHPAPQQPSFRRFRGRNGFDGVVKALGARRGAESSQKIGTA